MEGKDNRNGQNEGQRHEHHAWGDYRGHGV
jgi:hypothetical protein